MSEMPTTGQYTCPGCRGSFPAGAEQNGVVESCPWCGLEFGEASNPPEPWEVTRTARVERSEPKGFIEKVLGR